jgi:hypothetical protein
MTGKGQRAADITLEWFGWRCMVWFGRDGR